jgi:uncharacterized membrane protein YhiD involved in acid resistance
VDVEVGVGLGAAALVVGWPLLILVGIWLLGRLEAWMLHPDERAAKVQKLLSDADHPDEVETAVTRLLSEVSDRHFARRERS